MDKRKYRRVPFHVTATVQTGQISLTGSVENLSMKGMFFNTKESLPSDCSLEISIILSGTSSLLSVKANGFALRQTDAGVAIEFSEIDMDSFIHLKNIVALNSGDADAVSEEYFHAITAK